MSKVRTLKSVDVASKVNTKRPSKTVSKSVAATNVIKTKRQPLKSVEANSVNNVKQRPHIQSEEERKWLNLQALLRDQVDFQSISISTEAEQSLSDLVLLAKEINNSETLQTTAKWIYNAGGIHYKNSNISKALTLWDESCQLLQAALESLPSDAAEAEEIRLQLVKKYDLIAACAKSSGHASKAETALRSALAAYPPSRFPALVNTLNKTSVESAIDTHQPLYKIIESHTKLSIGDLCSEIPSIETSSAKKHEVELAFKELQLQALESVSPKSDVRSSKALLITKLLQGYQEESFPVRRARALMRQLQMSCQGFEIESCPRSLCDDILNLLKATELKHDIGLRHLRICYLAKCTTWMTLWCHRHGHPSARYRKMALQNWRKLLEPLDSPDATAILAKLKGSFDGVEECYTLINVLSDFLSANGYQSSHLLSLRLLLNMSIHLRSVKVAKVQVAQHAIDLTQTYMRLGYSGKAAQSLSRAMQFAAELEPTSAAKIRLSLANVKQLVLQGDLESCTKHLNLTLDNAQKLTYAPARQTKRPKVEEDNLLLIAETAYTRAVVNITGGNLGDALQDAIQAMRLLNRYSAIAAKQAERAPRVMTKLSLDTNPFDDAPSDVDSPKPATKDTVFSGIVMTSKQWRAAQALVDCMLLVAEIYLLRGSVREVEYFLSQALQIAKCIDAPKLTSHILGIYSEFHARTNTAAEAKSCIEKAYALRKGVANDRSMVLLLQQRGYRHYRKAEYKEALAAYFQAERLVDILTRPDFIQKIETVELGSGADSLDRSRTSSVDVSFTLSPTLQKAFKPSTVQRPKVNKKSGSKMDEYECLDLDRDRLRIQRLTGIAIAAQGSSPTIELKTTRGESLFDRIDRDMFNIGITIQKVLLQLTKDPIFGMLIDSAMSIPHSESSHRRTKSMPPHRKSHVLSSELLRAENILTDCIRKALHSAAAYNVIELTATLAFVMSIHAGISDMQDPEMSLRTVLQLELMKGVSMKRDLQDAIHAKFSSQTVVDDTRWPLPLGTGKAAPEEEEHQIKLHEYWTHIGNAYPLEDTDSATFQQKFVNIIPSSWTVISITVLPERGDLFISKVRSGSKPTVLRLPLNRQSCRDGDEEQFTYETATEELKSIVAASNETTHAAKDLQSKEAKLAWWSKRKELDQRLSELLDNVEHCWLGGFKGLLMQGAELGADTAMALRVKLEKVFLKHACGRIVKKAPSFHLALEMVSCLHNLGADAEDEELEDLIYHILDLYHFRGVPVAFDEIDFDQIIVDVKEVLASFPIETKSVTSEHIILLLDKNIQMIPWESIPCLRGRAVSRLPTISFLRDRILLSKFRHDGSMDAEKYTDYRVDGKSLSYILNPSKDLIHTQAEFSGFLESKAEWSGVIGRAPMEAEFAKSLSSKEVFVYFGHGGGEQYIRSHVIKQLSQCAVSILMGCSSGYLKPAGDFDPYGTPLNYMIAGCPALVSNLWDVTDKDIDRFSKTMFEKWGLGGEKKSDVSLVQAVAASRDACNLRFLNGASPVVYGIPVFLA